MIDPIYINLWLAFATVLLAIASVGIAIYSARKTSIEAARQIEEMRKSTEGQIETLKKIIEYQGHIEYGRLEYFRALNEFELKQDENELAIIQEDIKDFKASATEVQTNELEKEAERLSLHIRNRNILLERLKINFDYLDKTTMSILFDVDFTDPNDIKTCHRMDHFPSTE